MKWSSKVVEMVSSPDNIPNDPLELSEYFNGYNPKTDSGKQQYLRVRICSAIHKRTVLDLGKSFSATHSGSFNILPVQTEESVCVGNLIYSSRFTDTDHISNYLQKKTGFEWGFQFKQLRSNDNNPDWRKRAKIQTFHVPADKKEVAIAFLKKQFSLSSEVMPEFPHFTQKYLFAPLDHEHAEFPNDEALANHKTTIDRHAFHLDILEAKFTNSITGNLDRVINTRTGKKATLRELILSIKVQKPGVLHHSPLFHAVDFIRDSRSVSFHKNERGPGGSGHVFTFYKRNMEEAVSMIRGLGIYIGKVFGRARTYKYFSADHWKINDGWRWSTTHNKFITRESMQIRYNVAHDFNAAVLLLESEIQEESKEDNSTSSEAMRRTNHNPTMNMEATQDITAIPINLVPVQEEGTESIASTAFDVQDQLQEDLAMAQMDPDAQSLGNEHTPEIPNHLNLEDTASTTSAVTWDINIRNEDDTSTIGTNNSVGSVSTASISTRGTAQSQSTAGLSIKSINNTKTMEEMYDESLTIEENITNYDNYIQTNAKRAAKRAKKQFLLLVQKKSNKTTKEQEPPLRQETTSLTFSLSRNNRLEADRTATIKDTKYNQINQKEQNNKTNLNTQQNNNKENKSEASGSTNTGSAS